MEQDTIIEKPLKPVYKKLLKWILYPLLFICLLFISLITLLFVYEDEVKAAVIKELNKHLKAEVKIDPKNIDLTIIKSFPNCSVEFKNALMLEALPVKKRDTLLYAGQLNLFFNIKDLWNKNYEIKSILLKDAILKPVILKNGNNNYTFWEGSEQTNTKKRDSLKFNLNLLKLENCSVNFKNKKQLFKTEFLIKELDFKGHFEETAYDLNSSGEIFIKHLTQQKSVFLKQKNLVYSAQLAVNNNAYNFKKSRIKLNNLGIEVEGGFSYKDSLQNLDVNYKAPDLDIASVLSLLPNSYKEKINDYESEGNFYAGGNIKYNGPGKFSLESVFGIKNGQITYKPKSAAANHVNIEGLIKYNNTSSSLQLKNIYLNLNGDEIKGDCFLNNFSDPQLMLSAVAALNLQNLQNFWPIDTLTKLEGKLVLKTSIESLLSDLKSKTFSDKVKLNLEAGLTNLLAQFKGDDKLYAVENCSISAREREITVHDLKLKRGTTDLNLNGKMPGVFNYLYDRNNPLIITGKLNSGNVCLEDLLPKTNSGESSNSPLIPAGVDFKLDADIKKFSFGKFEANNITGDIEIKNQKAIVSEIKMETLEGEAEINAYADNSKGKLDVVLQSKLSGINIKTLFTQFNNFNQTTLVDNNIKGYASANINFSGSWSNKLEPDLNSIYVSSDLFVEKGELINFKPLNILSKFVDIKDLEHIRFSSLQSNIEIKNNTIYIAKTSLKNSALNIDFWGSHTFNNDVDYHFQLLISEYLAKRRKQNDNEFGPVEHDADNRRSAFILMKGNIDNPSINYDRKGLKDKIKSDLKQEKQNLKQILKEEFGLFKKDSVKKTPKKQDQVFELEKPNNKTKKQQDPKKEEEDDDDF